MTNLRYFDGIQYGDFQNLDVFVDPADNSLWITQPSMARMLGWDLKRVTEKIGAKSLKAFAGKALAHPKAVSGTDILGRPNRINAVPFDTFLTVLYWQLQEGNDNARSLLLSGFADSFTSMVLAQCGIQLSTEERQQVIGFYRHWYHSFQDWVRDTHIAVYGAKPSQDYYRKMAIAINSHLFERTHFYCDRLSHASTDELRVIENFQMAFLRTKGAKVKADPLKAVQTYINALEAL